MINSLGSPGAYFATRQKALVLALQSIPLGEEYDTAAILERAEEFASFLEGDA